MTVLFNPFHSAKLEAKLPSAWILSLFVGVLYPFCEEWSWQPVCRAAHWIADRPDGIYLSHTVLFWVVLYPLARLPFAPRFGLLAVGSLGVPTLLYRWVEQPLIKFGAHLSRRILRTPEKRLEIPIQQAA
jgi:peptidoglycan/LPS O-acetylase OafA/YrhL